MAWRESKMGKTDSTRCGYVANYVNNIGIGVWQNTHNDFTVKT